MGAITGRGTGWSRSSPPVGPGLVVMAEVLTENSFEMSPRGYEEVVEALLADGPHEPLGESIRPGRGNRGSYRFDADRGEGGVEGGGEFGVSVPNEESELAPSVFEVGGEVAGHLSDPGSGGVGSDAQQVHLSPVDFNDEKHVEAPQRDAINCEEVSGQDALA